MRLVWVVIPLILIVSMMGVIDIQNNAYADVCSTIDGVLNHNPENLAIVSLTITSSEKEIYDPPRQGTSKTYFNVVTSNFTINDVIYGNKDFPLKDGSAKEVNLDSTLDIGDKYVTVYSPYKEEWRISVNCPVLNPSHVIDYISFYTDLRDNPCNVDKDYLIKRSNYEKICVSEDTRDKLIERQYGFYLPGLESRFWKSLIGNQDEINSNFYKNNNLKCYGGSVLNGDYCLPTVFSMSLNEKKGNTSTKSMKNIHNQVVNVLLTSDKEQYDYPDIVNISGKFDNHIGKSIAFLDRPMKVSDENLSKLIYVDLENEINFQLGTEYFEDDSKFQSNDYYLKLRDSHDGLYEIKFSYILDDESKEFIYWKNKLQYLEGVEKVKEFLSEKAFFDTDQIDRFFKIYPEMGEPYRQKDSRYPEPIPEPEPTPKESILELQIPASFVDETKDAQTYVDRYNTELDYKKWFDENYSKYESIYHAVGLLQIDSEIGDD